MSICPCFGRVFFLLLLLWFFFLFFYSAIFCIPKLFDRESDHCMVKLMRLFLVQTSLNKQRLAQTGLNRLILSCLRSRKMKRFFLFFSPPFDSWLFVTFFDITLMMLLNFPFVQVLHVCYKSFTFLSLVSVNFIGVVKNNY